MEAAKIVLFIVFLRLAAVNAKIYQKCDLARELVEKHRFSRTMLSSWICMIEAESGFNTKSSKPYPPIVGSLPSVHKSFGLFHINSKNYCGIEHVGGKCKVRCEDMLKDDITKAAQCAQIVQNTEGFKAWKGWEMKCKPNISNLPPLNDCFRTKRSAAIAG
ncbi:lysozyme-like [Sitodiplosis mosellana]|uniref:lysozyme-like n=1 Tax=Sitodiplosis mosellana TaxID=263140 RepID=UPI002444AA0D|nr:lysozyme-like [Sitodiplosis mosellana]XP_055320383.1 lysozyme-like [Sitodiplosis mosellana]XP_055320384.1 lysozyme-like [Sitodiplosis mosellana]XP_055320386.1 lysozyme-like [Sitodiplosis mosellana]XP_055320387.1 lysozyme-like [Sitodiplosis mosellana]XP_055320388.1 lysozyme-like [Sitodiplosis mosellana]